VALSVSIYMFMVGLASLVWGPASDKYGRKIIYIAASIFFIATSIVCIFSPNIGVLVAFRALQGIAGVDVFHTMIKQTCRRAF
jgi:DHA1 family bicyclomycin/chloramphenicol resistance-like MFS transporter